MNINKPLIIKYYEYQLNATRTNEPTVYHFLMRHMESAYSCLSSDDLDYIECIIKDSGIDRTKKDAIAVKIIDKLTKETHYMNTIFETKEQHIAFRTKWKEIHAELRPQRDVVSRGTRLVEGKWTGYDITESALSLPYHAVYLAATGKLDSAMKNLHTHTRVRLSYGISSVFSAFGDTLSSTHKHLIEQKIHEFVGKY